MTVVSRRVGAVRPALGAHPQAPGCFNAAQPPPQCTRASLTFAHVASPETRPHTRTPARPHARAHRARC